MKKHTVGFISWAIWTLGNIVHHAVWLSGWKCQTGDLPVGSWLKYLNKHWMPWHSLFQRKNQVDFGDQLTFCQASQFSKHACSAKMGLCSITLHHFNFLVQSTPDQLQDLWRALRCKLSLSKNFTNFYTFFLNSCLKNSPNLKRCHHPLSVTTIRGLEPIPAILGQEAPLSSHQLIKGYGQFNACLWTVGESWSTHMLHHATLMKYLFWRFGV